MLPIDDVTVFRARAVVDFGVCATGVNELEMADDVLGRGHGHLLSVQDHALRLLLLYEPCRCCEVCCSDHITVRN